MKPLVRYLQSLATLLVLFVALTGAARAADLSQAVILVASERLAGSPFEQTVILAAPLPQGGHVGFVVNRPTSVKLETLFPEQASTHNVVDPVYAGGPMMPGAVFAVTRKAPESDAAGNVLSLMPGLVVVVDSETVDQIIETTPNEARYFVGLMVWAPDELDEQIDQGAWDVRPADVDTVLPSTSRGLWKSLSGTMV
jgi:putative transcriptional regulator